MQTISELLIERRGFKTIFKPRQEKIDLDQFTCILRIHVIHYLFYSELHKHFSIGVKFDNPKKDVTGRVLNWNIISLPKTIKSFKDAEELIDAITSKDVIKTLI